MQAPQPIEVLEHHGSTLPLNLLKEVLALTRMNWNTDDFSYEEPITLVFAKRVGHILSEVPQGVDPQAEYRFYM